MQENDEVKQSKWHGSIMATLMAAIMAEYLIIGCPFQHSSPPSQVVVYKKRTEEVLRDFPHKFYEDCRSLFIYVPGGEVETEDGLEKRLLTILPQGHNSISQLIRDYRGAGFSVACGDSDVPNMPETIRQHEENRQSYIVLERNQ